MGMSRERIDTRAAAGVPGGSSPAPSPRSWPSESRPRPRPPRLNSPNTSSAARITQAGGHPDLNVSLRLEHAAEPEIVRDLTFNLPEGVFGNPGAIYKCEAADFAIKRMPAGLAGRDRQRRLQLPGNPEHDPRHRSGLQHAGRSTKKKRRAWRSSRRSSTCRSAIPVSVRSGSDYGLQMSARSISQTVALSAPPNSLIWGFPADHEHDVGTLPSRQSRELPRAVRRDLDRLHHRRHFRKPANCPRRSSTTRASAPVTNCRSPSTRSATRIRIRRPAGIELSRNDRLRKPAVRPGLQPRADDRRSRRAVRHGHRTARAPVPRRRSADSLDPAVGDADPAPGPDRQPGRRRRPDLLQRRPGRLRPELRRAAARTTRRSGPSKSGPRPSKHPLDGSLYIGEPQPGNQYRLFMIFDGFGIHAKLIGRCPSRSGDRSADRDDDRPAAGAVRRASICTSSRPTAACWRRRPSARSTRRRPTWSPGTRPWPRSTRRRS